jgi:hypothetical protein
LGAEVHHIEYIGCAPVYEGNVDIQCGTQKSFPWHAYGTGAKGAYICDLQACALETAEDYLAPYKDAWMNGQQVTVGSYTFFCNCITPCCR